MENYLPATINLRLPLLQTLLFCFLSIGHLQTAKACYANFKHTNACAGDTVWMYGLDTYAAHAWDFGDETADVPNTAYADTAYHVYTTPGTYYITHFVNIGAEWAYETQAIEIGTDCFAAGFDTYCNGGNYMVFINTSIGTNLTYFWDFGDPNSGDENNSTLQTPYHYFTADGTYSVSLTVSDGINTETISQPVTFSAANQNCMAANISYFYNICAGDTTQFYVNYIGNISMVLWDFGDPSSGLANVSTAMNPTHYYSQPGYYPVTLIYSNGIDTDTLHWQAYVLDCSVWPGDVNQDGYVDASDIFPLGIYYGATGAARPNASTNFAAQACPDWTGSGGIGNDMYLQQMVNKKHADCNGDGIINESDLQAVALNFGQSHTTHNRTYAMQIVDEYDPEMYLVLPDNDLQPAQTVTIPLVLGTPQQMADNVYGFSIAVQYPANAANAQSISVDFADSWLGTSNELITFYTIDPEEGLIHIVAVRNNHTAASGQGLLATIHLTLAGNASGTFSMTVLPDAKIISTHIPMLGMGYQQIVRNVRLSEPQTTGIISSVDNPQNGSVAANLQLFPNPAHNELWVQLPYGSDNQTYPLELFNALCQKIYYSNTSSTGSINGGNDNNNNSLQKIPIETLPAGIYFVQAKDEKGNVLKGRFVKQ